MKEAGQIVVFHFPQTDLEEGKLRPALLLGKLPGNYDDWLICMISSDTQYKVQISNVYVNDLFLRSGEHSVHTSSVRDLPGNSSGAGQLGNHLHLQQTPGHTRMFVMLGLQILAAFHLRSGPTLAESPILTRPPAP
jgi:hypothetical protein